MSAMSSGGSLAGVRTEGEIYVGRGHPDPDVVTHLTLTPHVAGLVAFCGASLADTRPSTLAWAVSVTTCPTCRAVAAIVTRRPSHVALVE